MAHGRGTVKEPVGEFGHCRSLLGRAALDALWGSQGVGRRLGWVVGGIGGAAVARLAGVELEQPSPVVDAHQLAAQPDLHLLPRRTEGRRHRIEGVLAGHVVIGVPTLRTLRPRAIMDDLLKDVPEGFENFTFVRSTPPNRSH